MSHPNVQFTDASQAVSVALRAIFERWTALRLVIEHQFGGAPYEAEQLLQIATAMATNPSKRHSIDDYINLFYSLFERVNTDIEDGSPEEVAALILDVRDAAANGNFAPAADIAQKVGTSTTAIQTSVEGNQHEDEDNEFIERPGPQTRSQTMARAAVVDEDGFTQVQPRRSQRNL